MTVSASAGRQWTVNQMVARAYKYAGLLHQSSSPSESEYQLGRELLEDIIDSLAAESEAARAVTFYDLTITAAQVTAETYKFDMPSYVMDLLDPAMYIPASETDLERADGETVMRLIPMEDWHRQGAKSATGIPTRFAAFRVNDIIQAWVWPIPNEQGTIRFRYHRDLADVDSGTATLDLRNYWMDFVKKRLAADLCQANSMSLRKIQYLDGMAARALQAAKGQANPRSNNQIYVVHRGPYK